MGDHKDIFGPAKIQPVDEDEIEKQEGKKVRRKKKNLVVRKRKLQSASSSGSPEEEGKDGDEVDDGFNNYDQISAMNALSSSQRPFSKNTNRSSTLGRESNA